MSLQTTLWAAAAGVCLLTTAALGSPAESNLYYEVAPPFSPQARWEGRLAGGFDFSNPYLNVYALRFGGYRILSPIFAIGAEGTAFSTGERDSTKTLQNELHPYGYEAQVLAPQWSAAGVLRITPLAGLLNFFQTSVWSAEVSVLARAGAIRYRGIDTAPLVGTGLEVALGIARDIGLQADLLWDGDLLPGRAWQSRVGFHAGPVIRF